MLKFLRNLFGNSPVVSTQESNLADSEKQSLRLTLAEQETLIRELKTQLAAAEKRGQDSADAATSRYQSQILKEAAGPVSQLITQSYLLDAGKTVAAKDILAVANRLVAIFRNAGLQVDQSVGTETVYNPAHHTPLSSQVVISPGDVVIIRFPAVLQDEVIIRKALVQPKEL